MRARSSMMSAVVIAAGTLAVAQAPKHFNPMVDLLAAKKPVFGLYAPSNRRFGGGGPAHPAARRGPPRRPLTHRRRSRQRNSRRKRSTFANSDFIFDGSMEGDFDRAYPVYSELINGMTTAGILIKSPQPHLSKAVVVKTHEIAENPAPRPSQHRQAAESRRHRHHVRRRRERGRSEGRPQRDALQVQGRHAFGRRRRARRRSWGMSEKEYKEKADLWPLNPNGELVNWTIVESKVGLEHVREIAAVKGIGVLWPGAGTLRGVFSTQQPDGTRKLDEAAWEASIQKVLAACKEFNVPCGYPATATDIEMRMKQGFSVFVMNWGDPGFKAIEIGKKAAGR